MAEQWFIVGDTCARHSHGHQGHSSSSSAIAHHLPARARTVPWLPPLRWVVGCEMPSGMILPELNASRRACVDLTCLLTFYMAWSSPMTYLPCYY